MRRFCACLSVFLLLFASAHVMAGETSAIPQVTAMNFAEKVLQSPVPVVLQFDAKWCPYCRKVQPLLSDLARDKAGKVVVYRMDVDAERGMAQLFNVKSLPTIILLKRGVEVSRIDGVPSKAKLYLFADK